MRRQGIVLYGPPASGKDTITKALTALDPRYVQYERLKAGSGRTHSYRMTTRDEIDRLREHGDLIYENTRYGNLYAIDRPSIDALLGRGLIPIVHLGQLAGLRALSKRSQWLAVLLWCSRECSARRAEARGSTDLDARLRAWDETEADLKDARPDDFVLRIDTNQTSPLGAARAIAERLYSRP